MHTHRTRSTLAGVIALGLTVAACGGGGDDGSAEAGDADGVVATLPEPAEGPAPELAVTPEAAAASPLPELAVRQLNGEGGWVQFKNELPADRPVLVWFWAPH